jgi:hypothetical protein
LKRYWSGDMSNGRLTEDLRSFKPELMLLKNDARQRLFCDWTDAEYRLIYKNADNLLYVCNSIASPLRL